MRMWGKWNVFSRAGMSFALKAVMKVCITSIAGFAAGQADKSVVEFVDAGAGAQADARRTKA